MSDFLDITGASGTSYRFRRASLDGLPATAGNLLAVAGPPGAPQVLVCATADSLARAAEPLGEALGAAGAASLFIRLNVARAARVTEHADVVAGFRPARVIEFPDQTGS